MFRIVMLWVVGLVTVVPYGIYSLLFYAEREDYALLITLVLFWIFGFWGVVGPLLAIARMRGLYRALETAQSPERMQEILASAEAREAAIDIFAAESRLPRFLARKIFHAVVRKLAAAPNPPLTP